MLTLYVRVYSDPYTLSQEIEYPPVATMHELHELAYAHRNVFFHEKFIIENGVLRRYRKD